MNLKETELETGDVFINDNGDVFVKMTDETCSYLGNVQKVKTDNTLLFPILNENMVNNIGSIDISFLNKSVLH